MLLGNDEASFYFENKEHYVNYGDIHNLCHAYFVESPSKELINLCML